MVSAGVGCAGVGGAVAGAARGLALVVEADVHGVAVAVVVEGSHGARIAAPVRVARAAVGRGQREFGVRSAGGEVEAFAVVEGFGVAAHAAGLGWGGADLASYVGSAEVVVPRVAGVRCVLWFG